MSSRTDKTMRHFYCRNVLWDLFEAHAPSVGCSIDYLINQAMSEFARRRGLGARTSNPDPKATGPIRRTPLPPPPPPSRRRLVLLFNGQRIPINKNRFVIGRAARTSDLAIKDGNISRQHAAIIRHEGAFFVTDLNSTNGIIFRGERIRSRRIGEGDRYDICDYQLQFTYLLEK